MFLLFLLLMFIFFVMFVAAGVSLSRRFVQLRKKCVLCWWLFRPEVDGEFGDFVGFLKHERK